MRILGIDPGIGVTGFVVLDEDEVGRLSFICAAQVRSSAGLPFPERLKKIFDAMLGIIDDQLPSSVALEDSFLSKNVKSALKLGQARGVALLSAALRGLPVVEYSPTAVKMAVVGYGGASKGQVQDMVCRLLNLPEPLGSEHQADAAAVAICHAHSARFQRQIAASSAQVSSSRLRGESTRFSR